jgi:dipeptidyl aminopeptidase/acylaminoacyl peptidase
VYVASAATYTVRSSSGGYVTPLLSSDGATVALLSAFEVEFVDVASQRRLGDPITTVGAHPSFSPDGSLVAIPSFVGVIIMRVPSLEVVAAVPPREPGELITDVAWRPDALRIALTSQRGRSRIVDARTGADVIASTSLEAGSQLRWSSDGSRIAVIVSGNSSRIIDARTGDTIVALPSVRGPIELAGWTRNDQRLLVVRAAEPDDVVVEFIDTTTGQRVGPPSPIAKLDSFRKEGGLITDEQLVVFSSGAPPVSVATNPSGWVATACQVADRNLTESEWATYVMHLGPWRATCPVNT